MFGKIAGFEFRYQIKNPLFWVAVILFGLLSFGLVASENVSIGSGGNIHKNAATVIVTANMIFSSLFMLISAAFVAGAVTRDDETGYGPILRTTRVSKFDYLYGRFAGAFAAAALAFLAVPLGLMLGAAAPWVDKETLGPFVFQHYAAAYLIWALPNIFIGAAVLFALATLTRSMLWAYVGVVAILILRTVLGVVLRKPGLEAVSALWEPFGAGALGEATRYWTASESNALVPAFKGLLLANRAIWVGVGAGMLGLAYVLFRFESAALSGKKRKAEKLAKHAALSSEAAPSRQSASGSAQPAFGPRTTLAQLWVRTRLDMGQVFGSPAYFVLIGLSIILSVGFLWLATDVSIYGGQIYPVTRAMIGNLQGNFSTIAVVIAVYYSGELVWREQEKKTHELVDATPVPDWTFVVPKVLAIALVLFSTLLISVLVGVVIQTFKGYTHYELGKYLWWYVLPQGLDFLLLAALSVFVQAIVPHKFIGWGVMVLYLLATIVMSSLGLEDNLYQYGNGPSAPLSDMTGTGIAGQGGWWFRLYWSGFALMLLVLAYGLWRRGTETRLWPRLRRLPGRLIGGAGLMMAAGLVVWIGVGGFIFLNTHVWNPYRTHLDQEQFQADYEKALLPFETLPQPKITDVVLRVDLHPRALKAVTDGVYVLENRTAAPIRDLHVRFDRDLKVMSLSVEGARPTKTFEKFNYRIFTFDMPMQPGERRRLSFQTEKVQRGFKNTDNITDIAENGTFLDNYVIAPMIGMDRSQLLQDRARRRKYGLPPELRVPDLDDAAARQFNLFRKDSDWVNADLTLTTDADQTPMAPGYAVSDTTANGRRTLHTRTEAPINNFFSLQSAHYAVKRDAYKGVDLAVYYDAQHPWNVERMLTALRAGLDYDQANFSPYQFRQVRILEFPAPQGAFAQSFANTIPWSEGLGFIFKEGDPSKDPAARIDMITYVTAHELGHQWWGHQLVSANVQGSTMLIETFAQYTALMAMEHMYGRDQIRKFLKYELDSYLKGRGGDPLGEQPLYRVEGQGYVRYRKGSLVMYRLKDQLGEETVNRALRRLLKDYAFKAAPYPTTRDFLKDLREEAGPDPAKQQLITDLFENITLYDLKAKSATATKRADGQYDVALTVQAGTTPGSTGKEYDDAQGRVIGRPTMNEQVEVGLFTAEPGKGDFGAKDVLVMQRVTLKSGPQTIHFITAKKPVFAGVDPYNTLIDRNSDDNVVKLGG
jgi:aminopeptidase N